MDEQFVRQLVRQAIARHVGAAAETPSQVAPLPGPSPAPPAVGVAAPPPGHASFARFHLVRAAGETECLIEPSVTCNHCGHCQCYGH
ncbi:MAG: hypothetical protein R2708_16620 [Vicinamibacterales bacterium]